MKPYYTTICGQCRNLIAVGKVPHVIYSVCDQCEEEAQEAVARAIETLERDRQRLR